MLVRLKKIGRLLSKLPCWVILQVSLNHLSDVACQYWPSISRPLRADESEFSERMCIDIKYEPSLVYTKHHIRYIKRADYATNQLPNTNYQCWKEFLLEHGRLISTQIVYSGQLEVFRSYNFKNLSWTSQNYLSLWRHSTFLGQPPWAFSIIKESWLRRYVGDLVLVPELEDKWLIYRITSGSRLMVCLQVLYLHLSI